MTSEWIRGVRLGIDVGTVRVGVAICDPDGILATPLVTLARDNTPGEPRRPGTPGEPSRPGTPGEPPRLGAPGEPSRLDKTAGLGKTRGKGRRAAAGVDRATGESVTESDGPAAPAVPRDIAEIARLVAEHACVEVVVGLPVNLAGVEGPAAKKVRQYARILGEATAPVPIVMADERMSTVTAARRLSDRGVRGKSQRAVVDQAAAVEILQHYLESRRRQR